MLKETTIQGQNSKKSENIHFFISVQQCETSAWAKYLFAEYVSDR